MSDMLLWLDDAIGRHQNGDRFHLYMPALDWVAMDRTHNMPRLGAHLVSTSQDVFEFSATSEPLVVKAGRIIQSVLNISEHDFDPDVPLTSYGMDSLSAGRLSCVICVLSDRRLTPFI
jgi:hypothetical protein